MSDLVEQARKIAADRNAVRLGDGILMNELCDRIRELERENAALMAKLINGPSWNDIPWEEIDHWLTDRDAPISDGEVLLERVLAAREKEQ